jgi:Putative DNA-binding domain
VASGKDMLNLETQADLERLITDQVQESLTLDYKASAALGRDKIREICKDVSAFANSAGGQILYGIEENGHLPMRIDDGVDPAAVRKEWIEQIIDSNVQPRIEGLRIQPIPLASGRTAYVVSVPQATTYAPHQAPDNRYYFRQNFQSVPMEDYQVRDALRRATTPELFVRLKMGVNQEHVIEFTNNSDISKPIGLTAFVGNRANQPAFHTIVQLAIDSALQVRNVGQLTPIGPRMDERGREQNWFTRSLTSPPELPIFREAEPAPYQMFLTFSVGSEYLSSSIFYLTTVVQTPGFKATERWVMESRGGTLRLYDPTHHFSRTA